MPAGLFSRFGEIISNAFDKYIRTIDNTIGEERHTPQELVWMYAEMYDSIPAADKTVYHVMKDLGLINSVQLHERLESEENLITIAQECPDLYPNKPETPNSARNLAA